MSKYTLYLLVATILLCGCANGKFGSALQGLTKGQENLTQAELRQKAATLQKAVKMNPASATANFSYGRVLLATHQPRQALPYLEKAVVLDPDNAVYLFWQGVAYGENKKTAQERLSYERALQYDKNYVPALIYLGNNYLNAKAFPPAFNCYKRALAIDPTNPQALYNRAIILRHLHRTPEEKMAWRLYLESHPSGELARRAADHLNLLDDFSYRNHHLGSRTVPLPAITFAPFTNELTPASKTALNQIGTTVSNLKKGKLDILVYQKNNRELARKQAIVIKKYLENRFQVLKTEKRIRLSWFDIPEKRKLTGRTARIDESVVFFLSEVPVKKANTIKKKGKRGKTIKKKAKLK